MVRGCERRLKRLHSRRQAHRASLSGMADTPMLPNASRVTGFRRIKRAGNGPVFAPIRI
jgi:hypothetical protein